MDSRLPFIEQLLGSWNFARIAWLSPHTCKTRNWGSEGLNSLCRDSPCVAEPGVNPWLGDGCCLWWITLPLCKSLNRPNAQLVPAPQKAPLSEGSQWEGTACVFMPVSRPAIPMGKVLWRCPSVSLNQRYTFWVTCVCDMIRLLIKS